MQAINFLDWRHAHVKIANRRMLLFTIIIAFLISVVGMAIASILQHGLKNITNKLNKIDSKILQQQPLLQEYKGFLELHKILQIKTNELQNFQANRLRVVAIFDDLIRIVPATLTFSSLTLNQDILLISGIGTANFDMSTWLSRMQGLAWVMQAKIITLKNLDSEIHFELEIICRKKT